MIKITFMMFDLSKNFERKLVKKWRKSENKYFIFFTIEIRNQINSAWAWPTPWYHIYLIPIEIQITKKRLSWNKNDFKIKVEEEEFKSLEGDCSYFFFWRNFRLIVYEIKNQIHGSYFFFFFFLRNFRLIVYEMKIVFL